MRKFVISDLYGNKEMYDFILSYLEDVSLLDDVFLVINGNLIDSSSSLEILRDVQKRIQSKNGISIEYLGGKQELRLYQHLLRQKEDKDLLEFLGNLNTYYLFPEAIHCRPILTASSALPRDIYSPVKIKDNNSFVFDIVERNMDLLDKNFATRPFRGVLGRKKLNKSLYFFIRGNTPIYNEDGFFYNSYEQYLTIDGRGRFFSHHVPLVEVRNHQLILSIFDEHGKMVKHYLLNGKLEEFSYSELEEELFKPKQLIKK